MKRYALVIGISAYDSNYLPKLAKPAASAEAIAQILEQHGDFQEVRRLPANWLSSDRSEVGISKLTANELSKELKRLLEVQLKDGGEALIYFSGHGFVMPDNMGESEAFLAASDTQIGVENGQVIWQRNSISLRSLSKKFSESKVNNLVVLLDCCHSGSLIESKVVQQVLTFAGDRSIALMAACRDFEKAYEGGAESPYSIFTTALLTGLSRSQNENAEEVTSNKLNTVIEQELRGTGQEPVCLIYKQPMTIVRYSAIAPGILPAKTELQRDNPYLGLYPFEEKDAERFFGREQVIWDVINCIDHNPFLAVMGSSGSGKSSLIKAGVLPKLRQRYQWQIAVMTPGKNPRQKLIEVLEQRQTEETTFLLIIDQFEEVFTLCEDQVECQGFFRLIAKEVSKSEYETRIAVVIRADFMSKCGDYAEIADLINASRPTGYVVKSLCLPEFRTDIEQAIALPALRQGVSFESGLVAEIVSDVIADPGALPLLQYALKELWKVCIEQPENPEPCLTWKGYEQIGKVGGALTKQANLIYDSFSKAEQQFVRYLFAEELVQLGEGEKVTRRRTTWKRLESIAYPPELTKELVREVVNQLAIQRLIVTDEETVEVAHESLLSEWALLKQWIDTDREKIRLKHRIESECRDWQEKYQKSDKALLMGALLATVEEKLDWEKLPEAEYVKKSLEKRDHELTFYRATLIGAVASLFCITVIAIFAGVKWQAADRGQIEALTTSSTAKFNENRNSFNALIDALKAAEQLKNSIVLAKNPESQSQVIGALIQARAFVKERNRIEQHNNYVSTVSYSPDGKLIATGSGDNTVKLWDLERRKFKTLPKQKNAISSVSFNHNSSKIATASYDGTVKLWNAKGNLIKTLQQPNKMPVYSVTFSPDGTIATASSDATVKLWDKNGNFLQTLNDKKTPDGHKKAVYSVSFSPNGNTIATGSHDKTVKIWTQQQGKWKINILNGHTKMVTKVSFNGKGDLLASASNDKTAILWDLKTRKQRIKLTGHIDGVKDISFNPKEPIIATASADNKIKLWDLKGKLLNTLAGHTSRVNSISFKPDGSILASGSNDKTVKLWAIKNNWLTVLTTYENSADLVKISPDGQIIATASNNQLKLFQKKTPDSQILATGSNNQLKLLQDKNFENRISDFSFSLNSQKVAIANWDGTVQLWNRQDNSFKDLPGKRDQEMLSVSISPDGEIAAGTQAGLIQLWAKDQRSLGSFPAHKTKIFSIKFSPDNNIIASADDGGNIKLWNRKSKKLQDFWQSNNSPIYSIDFSPDSQILATASEDNTVKLWKQDSKGKYILIKTLKHDGGVASVSFSKDGNLLASASDDKIVRIWTKDGTLIKKLTGHQDEVTSVSFSPNDNNILASSSSDQKVLLWDLDKLTVDELRKDGCEWLQDYRKNNSNAPSDICNDVK
ncbi:peptidase C14 caspase catalytic subunit p20 [Crinalium epipsammum PCC 9333]|uniref:Peptidase C14 caspase catalytic subunit p20 n=1 Tax=Crinalium epipsammum PCC 9333 TaxID=1173022 RepID=K9W2R5_9CYAN|nr:caspase family protein [Crinalium epipsammum]AFZ14084.1 peptidase C14 caspase catalytic subunit p20 [Crinalium epipsammum PCC 9333]